MLKELDSGVEVTVELGEADELPGSDNVEETPTMTEGLADTLDFSKETTTELLEDAITSELLDS
jgi:hypothetical protein